MKINKNFIVPLKLVAVGGLLSLLAGCATPVETYYPHTTLNLAPKQSPNGVEVITEKPSRAYIILGEISLGGRPINTHQDLIDAARKKGAEIGADFVWIFNTGTETASFYNPGFSSFSANRYAASGLSVGPSMGTRQLATMHAMAGVYTLARTGLLLKQDKDTKAITVTGFRLNSKAQEAGIQVGDQLIGEDGFDADDKALNAHLVKLRPGQKVKLSVLRNGVRKDIDVELVPN